jgi:rhamnose transport system ATP-binding protein
VSAHTQEAPAGAALESQREGRQIVDKLIRARELSLLGVLVLLVLGKWLATNPKVIILDEPTKGIDIGSKAAVHRFVGELVKQGLSVILVSSELPEVLGLSDRIVVMHQGRVERVYARGEATPENVCAAASGAVLEEAA